MDQVCPLLAGRGGAEAAIGDQSLPEDDEPPIFQEKYLVRLREGIHQVKGAISSSSDGGLETRFIEIQNRSF